jgi:plastocyanin
MFSQPNNPPSGNTIDIYASEYKFGTSASNLASPGPTLTFTAGQSVTITLHNVGIAPHNFAITTDKVDGSNNLAFNGAQIGTASNPVQPGGSASATFTVGTAGSYYYICQVDGHVSLGMWGTVTVTS